MSTYKKAFQYLYKKYANSGLGLKPSSFDRQKLSSKKLGIMNLWSFRRDFLEKAINKYELTQIVNLVNSTPLTKQHARVNLDFKGFEQFLIQVAVYSHSKRTPVELVFEEQKLRIEFEKKQKRKKKMRKKRKRKFPNGEPEEEEQFEIVQYDDFRHMPPVCSLEKLIGNLKMLLKYRKCNTILFDNPFATGLMDTDIIKEMNRRLLNNPDFELPEGFVKKQVLKVEFVYHLPENLPVEESFRVVYSTVDQIFFDLFEFHIIEPISLQYAVTEAVPIKRKTKQK
jgi:hypothetical protein